MKRLNRRWGPGRRAGALAVVMVAGGLIASPALAGEVEVALQVGRSLPFYEQNFAFDPGGNGCQVGYHPFRPIRREDHQPIAGLESEADEPPSRPPRVI